MQNCTGISHPLVRCRDALKLLLGLLGMVLNVVAVVACWPKHDISPDFGLTTSLSIGRQNSPSRLLLLPLFKLIIPKSYGAAAPETQRQHAVVLVIGFENV